jgi:hypothetical protein
MKKLNLLMGAATLCAAGVLGAAAAQAQAVPRNYDRGPVTLVQEVEVKPGQMNAYMQDLANGWRRQMEEGKREGRILSYAISEPVDARGGEPNLYLITVFKDLAAMDRPFAEGEKSSAALFGSLDQAHDAQMKRESLRTLRGSMLMQDLEFTK